MQAATVEESILWDQRVGGSNPSAPTIIFHHLPKILTAWMECRRHGESLNPNAILSATGRIMHKHEAPEILSAEYSAEAVRQQLDLLVQDQAFRSSKRSVQFLS